MDGKVESTLRNPNIVVENVNRVLDNVVAEGPDVWRGIQGYHGAMETGIITHEGRRIALIE